MYAVQPRGKVSRAVWCPLNHLNRLGEHHPRVPDVAAAYWTDVLAERYEAVSSGQRLRAR